MSDSPIDLYRLEALANAATPGPWDTTDLCDVVTPDRILLAFVREGSIEDAEFTARARTAVPALVAEVRRLRQVVEQTQSARKAMADFMSENRKVWAEVEALRLVAWAAEPVIRDFPDDYETLRVALRALEEVRR